MSPRDICLCVALVGYAILAFPPPANTTLHWLARACAVVGSAVFVVLTVFGIGG